MFNFHNYSKNSAKCTIGEIYFAPPNMQIILKREYIRVM